MVRIIRSLALAAAILTAGVAAITMTPTAATAAPADTDSGTLGASESRSYNLTVRSGENMVVLAQGGRVEVRIYSEGGNLLVTRTIEAGNHYKLNNDLENTVRLKVEVSNPGTKSVTYGIGVG